MQAIGSIKDGVKNNLEILKRCPAGQDVVGFVRLVIGDCKMKGGWVLNNLRKECIDLRVQQGGRVTCRDSVFFDFELCSEVVEEGRS